MRFELAYRFELISNMLRTAPNGFLIRFEYIYLMCINKIADDISFDFVGSNPIKSIKTKKPKNIAFELLKLLKLHYLMFNYIIINEI